MRDPAERLSAITRLALALLFIAGISSTANAYTIVLLGGRQLQIPDQFTVTRTSLTYAVGATINATVLMAAIDVSATERANNEQPGSLLRRVAEPHDLSIPSPQSAMQAHRRTITNENLKDYALARRASEAAYEKRRIELGLPSLEDSKRKAVEAERSLDQFLAERGALEQQTREYWQNSANALRSELASLDAQINFVRSRLAEQPDNPFAGALVISNGWSFGSRAGAGAFPGSNFGPRPSTFVAPGSFNRIGPVQGGNARPTVGGPVAAPFNGHRLGGRFFRSSAFGSLVATSDYAYDSASLEHELDRLLEIRAGIEASQRELEDEARRAGVDPGWLRP